MLLNTMCLQYHFINYTICVIDMTGNIHLMTDLGNIVLYFFQYAHITNLYKCRPIINTCVYSSASNDFYLLLF